MRSAFLERVPIKFNNCQNELSLLITSLRSDESLIFYSFVGNLIIVFKQQRARRQKWIIGEKCNYLDLSPYSIQIYL